MTSLAAIKAAMSASPSVTTSLTLPGLTLHEAENWSERIESDPHLDPLAVTMNETDEIKAIWEVVVFFENAEEAAAASNWLNLSTTGFLKTIPEQDWVSQSLAGLAPVVAGRFFLHGAHDRDKRRSGGISLEIDAGTAFGTGHHGTTTGCLLALNDLLKHKQPRRILDVGCGTGVLAIAAAHATKSRVLASDIDAEAVRVTLANARNNRLSPQLLGLTAKGLSHPLIKARAPYDLIFANILARPLIFLSLGLTRILSPGGELILSGLTRDQISWVKAAYRNRGLQFQRSYLLENWATLVFIRPKKPDIARCQVL